MRKHASTALSALALACSVEVPSVGVERQPVVNGADDRTEYFAAPPDRAARLAASSVALLPRSALNPAHDGLAATVRSFGEVADLCPGEPFADEPAVAFCSGVLVDWDLVLTAGHCADLLPLDELAAVGGYYYRAPGELAIRPDSVMTVSAVVLRVVDPEDALPRRDFAFLRLASPALAPLSPAPIRKAMVPLAPGQPLVAMSSPGGIPGKIDAGGTVQDARADSLDYFVADTDTSAGSSGGGAFDPELALLGILARGQADFVSSSTGCNTMVRNTDPQQASEQFTYVARALDDFCHEGGGSSLCRSDCSDPCSALPPSSPVAVGCSVTSGPAQRPASPATGLVAFGGILCAALVRSKRRARRRAR